MQNRSGGWCGAFTVVEKPVRWFGVLFVLLLALTPLARAQPSAQDVATAVAPYVNDTSVFVVRCEVTTLDTDAIADEVAGLMTEVDSPVGTPAEQAAQAATAKREAKVWRDSFAAAGGKVIYAVVKFKLDNPPVVIVVPTTLGSKIEQLKASIRAGLPADFTKEMRVVDGAILASANARDLDGFPLASPKRTDELVKAFAACDMSAQVQGVFVPSSVIRKAFSELMPNLPEEAGGAPITTVVDGAQWGAISASIAPEGLLSIRLQGISPAAAVALAAVIKQIADKAGADADARNMPGGSAFVRMMTPTAQGDQVVLRVDGDNFTTMKTVVLPALTRARQSARDIASASLVRQIIMGCVAYAQANKNEYPPDLKALVKPGFISDQLLVNPAYPKRTPGYQYVKPDPKHEFLPDVVIVYEAHGTWPKNGIWVGFCDGHVERVVSEARFKELLANKDKHKK